MLRLVHSRRDAGWGGCVRASIERGFEPMLLFFLFSFSLIFKNKVLIFPRSVFVLIYMQINYVGRDFCKKEKSWNAHKASLCGNSRLLMIKVFFF